METGGTLHDREIQRLVRICQQADEAASGDDRAEADAQSASDAWAALFAHFHPRVRALCRRTLSGDIGDDLAADIMLKARFRLDSFDGSRPFAPWLFRIAANRCWDEARRTRRDEPLDDDASRALVADAPSPLDQLITEESRTRVQEALAQLPLRQRFALSLRYATELSYDEIASTLGVTSTNVGVLLLRGRRRLREILTKDPTGENR